MCGPLASVAVVCGDVQAPNTAPSIRHSNVPPSPDENVNVGVASVIVPDGPESIVVSGAVVSPCV